MRFFLRGLEIGFRFMSVLFFGISIVFWTGHIFGLQLLPEYAFKSPGASNAGVSAGGLFWSVLCFAAAWLVDRLYLKYYYRHLDQVELEAQEH